MTNQVADRSSNKEEQIVHAAQVIGRSSHRRDVFRVVYTGKTRTKSVPHIMNVTGLPRTRVLDAGKLLSSNDLVTQTKQDGTTAYEKIPFFQRYRNQILRLASNSQAREAIPTKRTPKIRDKNLIKVDVKVALPRRKTRSVMVSIDDIDSFKAVKKIALETNVIKIPESAFKNGVARILGERREFKDWGGELRDLISTRLEISGKRRVAAFAFKGPGTTGTLTPGKLGKNGDQIQRLLKCPAEVFIIQYWASIDDAVFEQLEKLVQLKSYWEDRRLWYGVIDGQDSARLIRAYPSAFPQKYRPLDT